MQVALAELTPVPGSPEKNVARAADLLRAVPTDLLVLPELFLSGYRIGDRLHTLAFDRATLSDSPLAKAADATGRSAVVGAPLKSATRAGEVENAAVLFQPGGRVDVQVKRYLPTYGPFEEGSVFTPTDTSRAVELAGHPVGLEICYDAFFPEVSRDLALSGAVLLIAISAGPVTSRRLFEKVLPARAVENALPLVYVNRVGVEDGLVFGGGSNAWDARGEPVPLAPVDVPGLGPRESVRVGEIDLGDAPRWRPFRPVLRDRAERPGDDAARGPPRAWRT